MPVEVTSKHQPDSPRLCKDSGALMIKHIIGSGRGLTGEGLRDVVEE
jgi:hypothetical protein